MKKTSFLRLINKVSAVVLSAAILTTSIDYSFIYAAYGIHPENDEDLTVERRAILEKHIELVSLRGVD